jgi:predicted urease superfamily metal-dependent hydrolase
MNWLRKAIYGWHDAEIERLHQSITTLLAERERMRTVYESARELVRSLREVNRELDERNVALEHEVAK